MTTLVKFKLIEINNIIKLKHHGYELSVMVTFIGRSKFNQLVPSFGVCLSYFRLGKG